MTIETSEIPDLPGADEMFDALRTHLFEWLPRQPWFDVHESEIVDITVTGAQPLHRDWPLVLWVPIEVDVDGSAVLCQALLALAPHVPDPVPDAGIVGEVPFAAGPVMVYDALRDPVAVSVVLDRIGARGAGAPGEVVDGPWVSTVELGQQGALTLYRRLQAGAHPDVELTAGIADRLRGAVVAPDSVWRSHPYDLASVRRTGRGGTVGTALGRASIDELLRRRCRPKENPLDAVDAFHELGRTLADLHVAAAERFGSDSASGSALADALIARLPRQLSDDAGAAMVGRYRRLGFADDLGRFVRVHGNFGLDAVERSRSGWTVVDLGCNPWSELMFEQQPLSPLGDLAGLLHDVANVAAAGLADAVAADAGREGDTTDLPAPEGPDLSAAAAERELAVLAEAWEEGLVDAIVAGYTSNEAVHRLLPVERISRDALLTVFELELSLRDTVREMLRGPDLLRIPVDTIDSLGAAPPRARW